SEAHVAFHRGHPETHKFRIIVSKVGKPCSDIYRIEDGAQPADVRTIEVGITGKPSDANFYLGKIFNRQINFGNKLDFRWLPDLEGPDVYDQNLMNIKDKFSTRLIVKNGTFYTYQRTKATFKAENGTPKHRTFGHIAKLMAANIRPLNNGESVYLHINGQDVLQNNPITNSARYE